MTAATTDADATARPPGLERPRCLAVYGYHDSAPLYAYAETVEDRLAIVGQVGKDLRVARVPLAQLQADLDNDRLDVTPERRQHVGVPSHVVLGGDP